ncbi:MAG: tRNA (adenosine(37)-N6)-dimethylallyltransferase MiaA [Euzebya sp.]
MPPVVALIGPTGTGKSDIAMQAALRANAVIVAVDAFTVYRQLSIGTAKPSVADQQHVPHRMVDMLDVEEDCTVGWFQSLARQAIKETASQQRPVLLVGGSGLYFRAVVDRLEFPPTDVTVRAEVQARVERDPTSAFTELTARDPEAAGRIDADNIRRITRALEVIALTGRRFSAYRTAWETHQSIYPSLRVIGLQVPREVLWDRIADRVRRMREAGWEQECRDLLDRSLSPTAAQAIGYAEILQHLREPERSEMDEVLQRIIFRTRRFAGRQRRWFTADPRVEWTAPDQAMKPVLAALTAPIPPSAHG